MFVVTAQLFGTDREAQYYSETATTFWSTVFSKAKFYESKNDALKFVTKLENSKGIYHPGSNTIIPIAEICNALRLTKESGKTAAGIFNVVEVDLTPVYTITIVGQVITAPCFSDIMEKLTEEERLVIRHLVR